VSYQEPGILAGNGRPGHPPHAHPLADSDRDPWLRNAPDAATTLPLPGQPGHGKTACLRRQPARITDGRIEGGYTNVFELICPGCGDHPYLEYSEIPAQLQQLRGPYPLHAGLAAYEKHLGRT
jgi:hypothetical protein